MLIIADPVFNSNDARARNEPLRRPRTQMSEHMKVGSFPMLRIDGTLTPATETKRLEKADMDAVAASLLSPEQRDKFLKQLEVDVAYAVPNLGRFLFSSAAPSGWSCASFRPASRPSTSCSCRRCSRGSPTKSAA